MPRLALYLLGPPRVELDVEPIHIGRTKAVALLAYLVVTDAPHRREALAALLWPEFDHSGARAELRRALSTLNRALGRGVLLTDRESVGLNPDASVRVDVEQFRELWADAQADTHVHDAGAGCHACVPLLDEAIALYRDDFMTGFTLLDAPAFDEWQRFESQRLRAELGNALEQLAACHGVQGAYEPAIAYAQRRVELDRLHEPAHRQLMELYAQAGDRNAALRRYQECVRILKEQLELPPSAETAALYERIRAGQAAGQGPEPAPSIPHNLPLQSTPFVGREQELAELDGLIGDPNVRLITIIGPGGIGKTRLALAVADRQLNSTEPGFPDGAYFVPLAQMSASDDVAPVVAVALDFRLGGPEQSRSGRQQMLDFLREKRMLLVLDNFEHLLGSPPSVSPGASIGHSAPGGGETAPSHAAGGRTKVSPALGGTEGGERGGVSFVADVLRTAPGVQLLVTSRERLPLREEQAFPISGLEYADTEQDAVADYAAARLFLQAARRAEPSFEFAPDEAASLSRVCRLLQGMPLAIELAATWVDLLSLDNMVAEIQRGLDFLAAEWHDAPVRHRSVRAAIDASWRRLTEAEQAVFAQLCVLRGGFTREAARDVAGADLRTLARLVNKSMLQFNRSLERYDVHELLRQYGCERLAFDPEFEHATRDCHSTYYCDALGRWGDAMNRGKQPDVGVDFEADWANLRVAWEWAADHGKAERLDLALDGLLFFTWEGLRPKDVASLFRRAVDGLYDVAQHTVDGKRVLAKTLSYQWECAHQMDQGDLAELSLEQAKRLLADPDFSGVDTRAEQAWLHTATAAESASDLKTARYHYERALALQQALKYEGQVAFRAMNIGWMYLVAGDQDNARRNLQTAVDKFRTIDSPFGELKALGLLGWVESQSGNLPESERCFSEIVELAEQLGRPTYVADGLASFGTIAMLRGDYAEAETRLLQCREIAHQCGALTVRCNALQLLGETAWYRGDVHQAERHWSELLALARHVLLTGYEYMALRWLSYVACADGDFGRAESLCGRILAGTAEGDLFVRALATLALARVAFFRGDVTRSIEHFQECLLLLRYTGVWMDKIRAVEGLTWAMAAAKRYGDAAQFLGFLATDREHRGMILPPVDQPHHDRALSLAKKGLGEDALATAWAAGAALTLQEAVDLALALSP